MADTSETSYVQVYRCENCYYASPLMADFLVDNCEITGKKDGHFECLYFIYFISFFHTNRRSCLLHAWRGKLKRFSRTLVKISNGTAYSRSFSFSKKSQVPFDGKFHSNGKRTRYYFSRTDISSGKGRSI